MPTHREPTHPGEMLLEEFLIPMGISQKDLADALHVPYQRINETVDSTFPRLFAHLCSVASTFPRCHLDRRERSHARNDEISRFASK